MCRSIRGRNLSHLTCTAAMTCRTPKMQTFSKVHTGTLSSLQHFISFLQGDVTRINWLKCKKQMRDLAFKFYELLNNGEKESVVNMSQVT